MFKKRRVQFQGGGMDAGAGQNFGGFRDRERDSNKPSTTSTTDDSTNTQTGGGSDSSQSQNLLSYSYSNTLGGDNINDTPANREILKANATINAGGGSLTDGSGNLVAAGGALQRYRDKQKLEEEKAKALERGYSPTTLNAITSLESLEDVFAAQREQLQNVGLASIDPFSLTGQYNYANQLSLSPDLSLPTQRFARAPVNFDFNPNLFGTEEEEDDPGFFRTLGENLMTDASNIYGAITDPIGTAIKAGETITSNPITGGFGPFMSRVGFDMFNTNYTQNEDGTISSSLTGALGLDPDYTNLKGLASAKNLIGYDNMTEAEQEAAQQDILRNIVTFDDTPKGYSTDFSNIDRSLYKPGMDLEQNLRDQRERDRQEGNIGGPAEVYKPTSGVYVSSLPEGSVGLGDPAAGQQIDYQGIFNSFSEDQKLTANKIMAMDEYDLPYAVDYVRMGGPLF